ncbi:MAG: alpha/beta hydrolase [Candidatus Nanopelagicales bacterium]
MNSVKPDVTPAFGEYLEQLNVLIAQATAGGVESTPETARAALASLNQFSLPKVEIAEITDSAVTYEHDGPVRVPVRIYNPRPGQVADVIVFVHGGGHMAGDLDVYDFSARRTAAASGMLVVSVDYRRSPEARYPLGVTDTHAVLTHLDELLADYPTTGTVYGVADSGGGAVLATIAQFCVREEWASPISRQVLIYPSLDYTMSGESMATHGQGYFLEASRVQWYFERYFPPGVDWKAASPMFGPFCAGMPDTLVIVAKADPLRSEGETYVAQMRAAGAQADLIVAPGMIHAYLFFETMAGPECLHTYEIITDYLTTGRASWSA